MVRPHDRVYIFTLCAADAFAREARAWQANQRDTIAVAPVDRAILERAVTGAERRFGLTTTPGATVVRADSDRTEPLARVQSIETFVKDPSADKLEVHETASTFGYFIVGFLVAIYGPISFVVAGWWRFRNRPAVPVGK